MSGWASLTLVTDAELGALEPEAISSDVPWGAAMWPDQRAEAKRELRIWLETDYPEITGVADRLIDTWPATQVYGTTGGTDTDYTTAAAEDTEADVPLATVWTTPASDTLDIGAPWTFDGVSLQLLTTVNANASVLTAYYWGAAGWVDLSATDGTIATTGKTLSGSGRVTWTIPGAWQRRTLHGSSDREFWVRLKVSAALTASTSASQVLTIRAPDGLKRVTSYLALCYIFRGLAAQSPVPQQWIDRANDYLQRAEGLYAKMREKGAIPLDYDRSQAIETSERAVARPLVIRRG